MTEKNNFPMPMLMNAADAAAIIGKGIKSNPARISFPWRLNAMLWLLQIMPQWLTARITERLPRKQELASAGLAKPDQKPRLVAAA
jgi:hypothetical protein